MAMMSPITDESWLLARPECRRSNGLATADVRFVCPGSRFGPAVSAGPARGATAAG
jgi:hypothetical protein